MCYSKFLGNQLTVKVQAHWMRGKLYLDLKLFMFSTYIASRACKCGDHQPNSGDPILNLLQEKKSEQNRCSHTRSCHLSLPRLILVALTPRKHADYCNRPRSYWSQDSSFLWSDSQAPGSPPASDFKGFRSWALRGCSCMPCMACLDDTLPNMHAKHMGPRDGNSDLPGRAP